LLPEGELGKICEKVIEGKRIGEEEALKLYDAELLVLGFLSNLISERKNGKFVYFNVNLHITPTNICIGTCKFCAFRKKRGEDGAFTLTVEEILEKIRTCKSKHPELKEVHIVGGLNPEIPYDEYLKMVREIKSSFPDIFVKSFTAEEVAFFSKLTGKPVEKVLEELIEAGVDALPGGGGEVFDVRIRKKLCPDKISSEEYLKIHEIAHRLGLKTNATMLFGHIEKPVHRIKHLLRLRELQDKTGGFQAFIPLAFHPENTKMSHISRVTACEVLRTISISRIVLDNFPHIKAYWVMLGEETAQTSLNFGADDIDGTVVEEEITKSAGGRRTYLPKERIIELIKKAGKIPVERDTLYNIVQIH
jgi:aminodeoxyfutalosine synthase